MDSSKDSSIMNEEKGNVNIAYDPDSEGKNASETRTINPDDPKQKRDNWDNPIEFLFSCISMSVGLGNIWRFPFVAYDNGGGAFLIPYLIVLIIIGRPLYFLEMVLGQFSSSGSVEVWNVAPVARGIGYGQAMAGWCVLTYYCVLMALALFYLLCSFLNPLPWTICDPAWSNNETCYGSNDNITGMNLTGKKSSAEAFFINYVLKKTPDIDDGIGAPDWRLSLCLLVCWLLIFASMAKGISSSGKVAYFTALFPYVVLITLLIKGATLPGADKGVLYFITPVWEKILEPKVWYNAVAQCFFSLSVGFGNIVTFASYNKFRHPIYRDSTIVSLTDTGTSLLAGFTIFAVLGNLAEETGKDISEVALGGTGMAFISYPEAIAKFDNVPQLFAVLFFLMLLTIAMGSASGIASMVITLLCDNFPAIPRWAITAFVVTFSYIVGLVYVTPGGQYILDLVDYFGGSFVVYIIVITQSLVLFYVYGLKQIVKDIRFMLGFGVGIYFKLTWAILIPVFLIVVFVYAMVVYEPFTTDNGNYYPPGATAAGWILASIAIAQIPAWGAWVVYNQEGVTWWKRFRASFRPTEKWGPADSKLKSEWKEYNQQDIPFTWTPKIKCRRKTKTISSQ